MNRVLYTGPGLAGASTSVRSLAQRLGIEAQGQYRVGFTTRDVEVSTDVRTSYYFSTPQRAIESCRQPDADAHMRFILPLFERHLAYLRDLDGVVFVADSQVFRSLANVETLEQLKAHLELAGRVPSDIPIVFECNKQELPETMSIADLAKTLTWPRCRHVQAVARRCEGVVEAFDALLELIA